ncbi:MAG: histone deacetylase family protein [Candidatus Heimdallarchaeota archaeon]
MQKQIIFSERFCKDYSGDPASEPGRMEAIIAEMEDFELLSPDPASEEDILLVHTPVHLQRVKRNPKVFPVALLSVGGAIKAADSALASRPMFAVIRPPGHHASPEGYWGFCYFNNVAIAIRKMLATNKIDHGVVIDFDYHFGDGTDNTFNQSSQVQYYWVRGHTREEFIGNIGAFLTELSDFDLLGVSAGFDRHIDDWGGLLTTDDYYKMGKKLKEHAKYRFAVLEGGYNHDVLGKNVRSFIEGFY